jgi:endonuclease III-like uncharacterized protein
LTGKGSSDVIMMIVIKKNFIIVKIYVAVVLDLICLPEITDEIRHSFCSRGFFSFLFFDKV